ncbi:MAG TPA: glycosyltransferase family 4 protein [Planctomycetaceae bacterium]|nr:glycosyltransferase family 4 protein [Planctomycetaceae bacterium]
MRVTFLTTMPSPYSVDLFAAIEADGRIAPRVLYMEMAAPDTYWGQVPLPASSVVLPGGWKNIGGGRVHWNSGVIRALRESRPDLVVVSGYNSLTCQRAMRWLHRRRLPWVFWGEVPGMRTLGGLRGALRTVAQRPALRWPDAIAAIGIKAVEEYRRLAGPRMEIVNIPYHTDLKPFLDAPRMNSSNLVRVLYCGQLIERKGLRTLLDAFLSVADEFPQSELILVGEGPLRESLAAQVPSRLQQRVVFAGFQPVDELPRFFSQADVFVLPSLHDGWGVVVNQALAAGLAVICSNAVGAAADLVSEQNGCVVPPADMSALATALRRLIADRELRIAFGAHSRAVAQEFLPSRGADRWVDLAERILARRVRTPVTAAAT